MMNPYQVSLSRDVPIPAADPAMLDTLSQPRLMLFWGSHTPTRTLLIALTALAARGSSPRAYDGGNRFDGYFVARLTRQFSLRATGGRPLDPHRVLNRIRLSRAFTCFQLAELIENTEPSTEPLFVLDLLSTFYDESVPLRDSERLLANAIMHLKRLATVGPVIVGAREPRTMVKNRWMLLDRLQIASDSSWLLRAPEETAAPLQQRLF
jgi:hypothetical protein